MVNEKHNNFEIIEGDIRKSDNILVDGFFQCIITSPPYFGLRKYSKGDESEIGQEKSHADYVQNIVECFSLVKKKLRTDGLLWLNIGDCYKGKNLLGVPWRVALALQDDGWLLRSDIIWHKPNATPSSVKDRPTIAHEYIFLFSKSEKYYYDADAIREQHVTFTDKSKMRGGRNHFGKKNGTPEQGKNNGNQNLHAGRWDQAFHPKGRNKRTVWEIPVGKFREAHFAVYPEKLVEVCLLASTKPGDIILDPFCGSGTTGVVALKHNRRFIGVELVSQYKKMADKRIINSLGQNSRQLVFDLGQHNITAFPDQNTTGLQ